MATFSTTKIQMILHHLNEDMPGNQVMSNEMHPNRIMILNHQKIRLNSSKSAPMNVSPP